MRLVRDKSLMEGQGFARGFKQVFFLQVRSITVSPA
jgi:hypothetical protein